MVPQSLSLTTHLPSSISFSKPINRTNVNPPKANPLLKSSFEPLKCSVSVISEPTHLSELKNKPSPSEVSRTIMELANVGTLSTLTQQSWPLGIGVRFAVDPEGTPILCLHASDSQFSYDRRSSLHVQVIRCYCRFLSLPQLFGTFQNFYIMFNSLDLPMYLFVICYHY